jgi:hypothetical protein
MNKPENIHNKVPLGITVDYEVLAAINMQRNREPKSTFVNFLLRGALGLEQGNENNGIEA